MKLKTTMIKLTAALAIAASTSVAAIAADMTLIISSWAPPTHGMNAIMWPNFIKMVEDATEGRVTAKIKYKLGSPPAQFDLIQDGAADVSWIFHGYSPGRFTTTKMAELPGYSGNAEASSVAAWRAYEKFFAAANEHRGVKVVAIHTHGPGVLHSSKQVRSLSDIAGMKLRLGGGVSGDVGAALGATGIRVPAPKVYETLASHAADGVMMPMEGKKGFKLTEVAQHTYTVPGGFYRGSFALIMNEDKFASISAADQAALDKVFGEEMSRMAGAVWDEIDAIGRAALDADSSNSYTESSAADTAAYSKMAEPIVAAVIAEVTAKGIDGAAAKAFIADTMTSQ